MKSKADIGLIGLAVMGENLVLNMESKGFTLVVFNRSVEKVDNFIQGRGKGKNIIGVHSLKEFISSLEKPRKVMLMVKAGQPVDDLIDLLIPLLEKGDIIIDGGNSNFNDTMLRAQKLNKCQIHFVDVGTSGGIWGLKEGYSLMIGGETEIVSYLNPIFKTLAPSPEEGWGHVGPTGAGHYVKMVHNGIEYGLMEAYAEGFEIMRARKDLDLDLHQISEIWRYGSVVRSWLLDLIAAALTDDPELTGIKGWVADSGEGRWTVMDAINSDIPAPVITLALLRRFESRQDDSYAAKLLAAMRNQFGGHAIKRKEEIG